MKNDKISNNPFDILINEQLSSVIFVQDYCQLDFDGNTLTCYQYPEVVINENEYKFSEDGQYRNKLCSIITNIVRKVELIENQSIKIIFDEKAILIPINYTNPKTIEVAYFKSSEGHWSVF